MDENNTISNTNKLNTLAPTVDKETYGHYCNQLKSAIGNKDNKNIAVMGPYGSGKSSFIKTFLGEYPDLNKKTIVITLASFNNPSEKQKANDAHEDNKASDNLEKQIEMSIIQQLLYRVERKDVPNSSIKRLKITLSPLEILCLIFFMSLIVFALAFHFNRDVDWIHNNFVDIIIIISILAIIPLLYFIYRFSKHLRIIKLKTSLFEADIQKDEFNFDLVNIFYEEILYFFQKTKYELVILEDLDRFESINIFSKLRELNTLLNSNETIAKKKKITFVYTTRDDIFMNSEERSKFFDLIFPIIPQIGIANARGDILKALLNCGFSNNDNTQAFISNILPFISEKRTLINIENEYMVYANAINPIDENAQIKLLTMIIYKNLYPKDFSKTLNKNGDIQSILIEFEKKRNDKQTKINDEINIITNEIESINSKYNLTLNILENALLGECLKNKVFQSYYNTSDSLFIDGIPFQKVDFSSEIKKKSIKVSTIYAHIITFDLTTATIVREIIERARDLQQYEKSNLTSLNQKILELTKQRNNVYSLTISEYLKQYPIESNTILTTTNLFLKTCFINKYIDETYDNYLSYTDDTTYTNNDLKFLQRSKSHSEIKFDEEINNIKNIIETIKDDNLSEYYLNFKLFDYCLNNSNSFSNNYFSIFKYTSKLKVSFLVTYLLNNKNSLIQFFKQIPNYSDDIWNILHLSNQITNDQKILFLKTLIENTDNEALKKCNKSNYISDDINNDSNFVNDFSDIAKNNPNKFNALLGILNIKINTLTNFDEKQKEALKNIIEENRYEITLNNINVILSSYYGYTDYEKSFLSTIIFECENTIFKQYMTDNFTLLLSLCKNIQNTDESSDTLLYLANDANEENSQEIQNILNKQRKKIKVDDVSKITNSSKLNCLLDNDLIVFNWENIDKLINKITNEKLDNSSLVNYITVHTSNTHDTSSISKINPNDESLINIVIFIIDNVSTNVISNIFDSKINQPLSLNLEDEEIAKLIPIEKISLDTIMINNINSFNNPHSLLAYIRFCLKNNINKMTISPYSRNFSNILNQFTLIELKQIIQSIKINNNDYANYMVESIMENGNVNINKEILDMLFTVDLNYDSKIDMLIKYFKIISKNIKLLKKYLQICDNQNNVSDEYILDESNNLQEFIKLLQNKYKGKIKIMKERDYYTYRYRIKFNS